MEGEGVVVLRPHAVARPGQLRRRRPRGRTRRGRRGPRAAAVSAPAQKPRPVAGHDDRPHRGVVGGLRQHPPVLGVHATGPRVQPLGPVQRDRGDAVVVDRVADDLQLHRATPAGRSACLHGLDDRSGQLGPADEQVRLPRVGLVPLELGAVDARHVQPGRERHRRRRRRVPLVLPAGVGVGVGLAVHDRHRLGPGRPHRHELGAEHLGGEDRRRVRAGCG